MNGTASSLLILLMLTSFLGAGPETDIPVFRRHGVAAPVGQAAWGGVHATIDGKGQRQILLKLWAGAGEKKERTLLVIDPVSGASQRFVPPDGPYGDGSFATFLSRKNRLYDMVAKKGRTSFYEFDVASAKWLTVGTLNLKGSHRFANSFTETDDGVIYAGILRQGGGLVSFDPESKKLIDHGRLLDQEWLVYPHLISDSAGWIYAATKHKEAHIIAFHPAFGKRYFHPEGIEGMVWKVQVYRADNGRAYLQFDRHPWQIYEAFDGRITPASSTVPVASSAILRSTGWRDAREFPDGSRVVSLRVSSRKAEIADADGTHRKITFDYHSTGAHIRSLITSLNGNVYGSTMGPLRFFSLNPATGHREDHGLADYGGNIRVLTEFDGNIYGAIYSSGALIEIDPEQNWTDAPLRREGNPRVLFQQSTEETWSIGRPSAIHVHRDGVHILVGGIPRRVAAGGGLLVYDRTTGTGIIMPSQEVVPGQAVQSLVSLLDGTVIGGSNLAAGTGGINGKGPVQLFVMDWKSRKVIRRFPIAGHDRMIADLVLSDDGKRVYGLAMGDTAKLLRFTPEGKNAPEVMDLSTFGPAISSDQPHKVLSFGPDGCLYILLDKGIVRFNTGTSIARLAAESPVPISAGGGWVGNELFFASGSDIWSCRVPVPPSGGAPLP